MVWRPTTDDEGPSIGLFYFDRKIRIVHAAVQVYSLGIMTTNAILDYTKTDDVTSPKDDMASAKIGTPDDNQWQAVLARDANRDGKFVFAVSSTGIYCRPSCPSRRPRRENVTFFRTSEEAEKAGYRACLRCRPKAIGANHQPEMVKAI